MRVRLQFEIVGFEVIRFVEKDVLDRINKEIIGVETSGQLLGFTLIKMRQFYDKEGNNLNIDEMM